MSKYDVRDFQVAEYWLGKKDGSPAWHRCWYEGEARQVRKASLGTSDFEEAKKRLVAWFRSEAKGEQPDVVTLDAVLEAYWEAHGKNIPSSRDVKISSRYWREHFGADMAADEVGQLDPISGFAKKLMADGHSPIYVNRILSVGRAALMRAYERRLIKHRPVVKGIRGAKGNPKGRPCTIPELQKLWMAFESEHMRVLFALGLGTGARPDAMKGLDWRQVNFEERVIELNPPGRLQTNKRRPQVPMCDELHRLLLAWRGDLTSGPVIHFRGKAVKETKTAWRNARRAAGLDEDINPYSLRHTVGKWLRSQSVPAWEVAGLLGHTLPGTEITSIYAFADPEHMRATKNALDKLLRAVCVRVGNSDLRLSA